MNIVKGKPDTESVTGNTFSGTGTTTWTYGNLQDCINLTNITKNGVPTDFTYYPKSGTPTPNDGNLWTITDANTHTSTYEWTNGRISKETKPNSIYYNKRTINVDGTIESETNGRGVGYTTHYLYDKNLRLSQITPQIGNPTIIEYAPDSSTRTDTRGGYSLTHSFDGFGRPSGSSDTRGVTTTISYKAYGPMDTSTSNIGDTTNFDYFGRPTSIVDKEIPPNTESYNYTAVNDKTTVTVTDKNNKPYSLTYNAFGNPDEKYLMSVRDQESNDTTYGRNILGNLTSVTQGNAPQASVTRSFTYGHYNNLANLDLSKPAFLVSETNPENGTITYVRDNVGNIYQKTDATGTATYIHDELNRLKSITKNSEVVGFEYDNADNKREVRSSAATITYDHDVVNRLHIKTETIAGRSYTTTYDYNANDILQYITYPSPSNRTVVYGINPQNQVESLTGIVRNVHYHTSDIHAGLPQYYIYENNVRTDLTYNNRQLLTDINAGSALTAHYEYDTRGNTQSFSSNIASTQSFTYDDLSRLKTFSGAWGSGSFTYYPNGNRWTKSVGGASTTYTYNNNNSKNRLDLTTGSEAATYSYNGNGALIGGTWGGSNYTLLPDAYDQLTSFANGTTNLASFAYDGDGQRVSKTAGGKKTVYHYDQAGHVISEDDGNGVLIADYMYLNGKLVAKIATTPTISVAPASVNFGNILVSTSSTTQVFTAQNTGDANLNFGTIALSGTNPADFAKTADGCSGQTLAPNASCTVHISFTPTSAGSKAASITIPSNDPQNPVVSVPISGNGILPILTISKNGEGAGTVTSSPGGISCGSTCSSSFPIGSLITLTASPVNGGSIFGGWSGSGCSGAGSCTVTLNSDTIVTATFNTTGSHTITVVPSGCGTVSPPGPVTLNFGSSQTFSFQASAGSFFTGALVDGISVGDAISYPFTNVVANHTLSAFFSYPDGDVNNNGTVDIADALTALRATVGLISTTPQMLARADVAPLDASGYPAPEGKLTIADALVILKKVVGLTTWDTVCGSTQQPLEGAPLMTTPDEFPAATTITSSLTLIPSGNGSYTIQGTAMDGVAGIQFTLAYDTTTLGSPSVTPGSLTTDATLLANTTTNPGFITIGIISSAEFSGSGPIAVINFATWNGASAVPTLMQYDLSDTNGHLVSTSGGATPAAMISPVNASTLTGASQTFTWTNAGADLYHVWIGTTTGAQDLGVYPAGGTTGITTTVTGLPVNSGPIFVRLYSRFGATWLFNDYTYTAAPHSTIATMTSPVNASTLAGASQTFTWTNGGADLFQIWVGTTAGAQDLGIYPAGGTTATTTTVTGLPTNNGPIFVRLYSMYGATWYFNDYTYTAASIPAAMVSPVNASTLTGASQTFTWTNAGADLYHVWIGTTTGAQDLGVYPAGGTTGITTTVTGLPVNSGPIFVRLYSRFGATWLFNDYTYTAAPHSTIAAMTSPVNASTLAGASQTFTWTNGGADLFQIWVGTTAGAQDLGIYPAGGTTAATTTVTGLPKNNGPIFVRLNSKYGATWHFNDYTYTAASSLTITTVSPLPGYTIGSGVYSGIINATGGSAPYTFSITAGALPDGIALFSNGQVWGGGATVAGTYNFTVTVTDSTAATAGKAFTLVVL